MYHEGVILNFNSVSSYRRSCSICCVCYDIIVYGFRDDKEQG